jgi:hypothetical protein
MVVSLNHLETLFAFLKETRFKKFDKNGQIWAYK